MVLTTQEHKKRKAECLEVLEVCTAFCIMESLGIVDLDEEELALVLGLAAFALDNMSQLPRELRPINPMQEKDDLQFEFAFCFTKEEVHRLLPCLRSPPVVYIEKVGYVDRCIFLLVLLHRRAQSARGDLRGIGAQCNKRSPLVIINIELYQWKPEDDNNDQK